MEKFKCFGTFFFKSENLNMGKISKTLKYFENKTIKATKFLARNFVALIVLFSKYCGEHICMQVRTNIFPNVIYPPFFKSFGIINKQK